MGCHQSVSRRASAIITLGYVVAGFGSSSCSEAPVPASIGEDSAALAPPSQSTATFTTVFRAPFPTEGLASDGAGNLYTAARAGSVPCPIYRASPTGDAAVVVGSLPAPCNPNGLVFGDDGLLYVTSGADVIYRLAPSVSAPPTATVFASGVPGANGLAFDASGNLWATDGGTGQGRVFSVTPAGVVTEKLRIQPLANLVNLDAASVGGVGRDARALPPGKLTVTAGARTANDTAGSVAIVANGIAFVSATEMLVTDTARGAIWKVRIDRRGNVRSTLGCDTTFTANTLCLENLFVQHPALEGLDGLVVDADRVIWATANERNAIVSITEEGAVTEVFRNVPAADTRLRNTGPLEFPTTPALVGRKLCLAQTDVSRRDNFPNGPGEVAGVGKVACLDQRLPYPELGFD